VLVDGDSTFANGGMDDVTVQVDGQNRIERASCG